MEITMQIQTEYHVLKLILLPLREIHFELQALQSPQRTKKFACIYSQAQAADRSPQKMLANKS